MIAVDTSAIVAILTAEPEEEGFLRLIASGGAVIGAPTLVETRLVLESRMPGRAAVTLQGFLAWDRITIAAFDAGMFAIASEAFARFGKGRGHPAQLNFGDCLAYAVARAHALPLLFKGGDFVQTDVEAALLPDRPA
ncbi:type II toxin-antitoxin system VapC family toxin [Methylobacterium organophilum]|uniref:type II toxin-antitoxin system VapC family toxin n=1 Tax=Methylobacterium organophilum TaxID=410 RepID=UPI001F140891|nr:type II toxin-antitoxin system VapC family toxin [Methylobacterium organophilum]UMY17897.1 type II toxin-antitoxin system VapC family toxin [Methylobacterium organophilum]